MSLVRATTFNSICDEFLINVAFPLSNDPLIIDRR